MAPSLLQALRNRLRGRTPRRHEAPSTGFAATEFSRDLEPVFSPAQPDVASRKAALPQPRMPRAVEGQRIGRYDIRGRLGSGGQGEVYDAWDPVLFREVALKVLPLSGDGGPRQLQEAAILNEARAAAGLNHPSIVTVFDAGRCEKGIYIAMQRLHGRDLRDALAGGWRPTVLESAQLVQQVAEGLAYAHTQGVVHCDIKPANIFLDLAKEPKVLDFGIARRQHDQQASQQGLPPLGSPQYLAPEQMQHGLADERTDVRALGVVLYELLTGRKAYDGNTVQQVMQAVMYSRPVPAREVRSIVPRALSDIAAQAMAIEPERRQASAAELAQALRSWLDERAELAHTPVPSMHPPEDSRPSAWTGGATGQPQGRHGDRVTDWAASRNSERAADRPSVRRAGGWKSTLAGLLGLGLCAGAVAWLLWLATAGPSRTSRTPSGATPGRAAPGNSQEKLTAPRSTPRPVPPRTSTGTASPDPSQTRQGSGANAASGRGN